ncbi:aminotransferase [Corynebacterium ulcerans]|uniref:Deoxyribose-phosphate aldolase n=2 Tax=Corynebacterium ulcerans TaxID=65058 RepID=A0ABD7MU33_CORUL|nr:aminotransferase [Corynebacterium ulcerans]AEG80831.1 Deoxyribose-phosphate aldolase [Corynebacterium ulcerans 809]AEG83013.1 Deoxyribose-phosphate aldolase [Corynebacterium ulcerans BR-AD22]AIU90907.1 Deoxyribose-phosphate aldolase [Corynebacterium ulcerans]AKN76204.1 Deoxyribose-phosphate aldolase [Corynebacterium ulcerans FRC58]KPH77960.1 aminotransferase [Corynebacterium ulcerans]
MTSDNTVVVTLLDPLATATDVKQLVANAKQQGMGICVEPSLLHAIDTSMVHGDQLPVISWAGYPTGKHHVLIKASEARLAVQSGATMVIYVPDPASLLDATGAAFISEIAAAREAVPHPAQLAVLVNDTLLDDELCTRAHTWLAKIGVDAVVSYSASAHEMGGIPLYVLCDISEAPVHKAAGAYGVLVTGI